MKRFTPKQLRIKQTLSTLSLAISIALLTACGGGGSSSNHASNQDGNQNSNPSDKDGQNGNGNQNGNDNQSGNGNGNQNGNDQSQELKIDESYKNPSYKLKNNVINIGSHYLNQYDNINTQLLN